MSFSTRLAKLEARHKQVLRCPWCLYHLGSQTDRELKRSQVEPDAFVQFKCWDCGTEFSLSMEDYNHDERYAITLILASHPSKAFNDERVYAVHLWFSLRGSEVKKYERETSKELNENKSQSSYPSRPKQIWGPSDLEKTKRKRDELKKRAFQFIENRREYYKRMANGPDSFPLNETLEQIEQDHLITTCYTEDLILNLGFEKYSTQASELQSKLDVCNLHLHNLKKREACEIVIWGERSRETIEEMRFFEQEKQRAIDAAVEVRKCDEAAKLEKAKRAEAVRAEAKRLDAEAQKRETLQTKQENQSGPIELESLKPEEIKALLSKVMEERSSARSLDPWWS